MPSKQNLILLFSSLMLCVYLFEGFLWASRVGWYAESSANRSIRMNAAIKQGIDFDTRSRLEFIQDSQSAANNQVLRISPIGFANSNGLASDTENLYPLAGFSNKATVYCNIYGEYLIFDSDRWGFRNPLHSHQKSSTDVTIIGDSFAMGHCEENDIASLLRQGGYTVSNLSYSGNGPLIELASLREYGGAIKSKTVLWLYYEGNDLSNLAKERNSALLKRYLDKSYTQNLIGKQSEINTLLISYSENEQKKKESAKKKLYHWRSPLNLAGTFDLLKKSVRQLIPRKKVSNAPQLPLFKETIQRAQADTSSWGGQMYFVYLPEWGRLADARLSSTAQQREAVLGIVRQLNIPVIDISDDMASAKDPLSFFPFRVNGHYNAAGYSLLADRIKQTLSKESPANEK
jgi:hypothetical protein